MNKIIFSLLFALLCFTGVSQTISEPYRLWPRSNFRPPQDTVITPERLGEMRYKASDSTFYKCVALTGQRWANLITANSASSLASVTAVDSLTKNQLYLYGRKVNNGRENIVFNDTLIPTIGNPVVKHWLKFEPLHKTAVVGVPFVFGSASSTYGTTRSNDVTYFGYNISPVGGLYNSGKAAIGIGMESHFQPSTDSASEMHFTYVAPNGASVRMQSFTVNQADTAIDTYFSSSNFYIKRPSTVEDKTLEHNGNVTTLLGYNSSTFERPFLRFKDKRNTAKTSDIFADTTGITLQPYESVFFDGKIRGNLRFNTSNNRALIETGGSSDYPNGGHIILNGYTTLGTPVNGGWGGVGSNYYMNSSNVLLRASADNASGVYFENGGFDFWNAGSGAANSSIASRTTLAYLTSAGVLRIPALASAAPKFIKHDALGNLYGSDTAGISLSAVGSTPNANAATLTGSVLNLEPASQTQPGVMTIGSQSIGGNKTFTGSVTIDGTINTSTTGVSFQEAGSIATPSTGRGALYGNSNKRLYYKDDAGVENDLVGPKQFIAIISQTGTDAPTATVVKNTMGVANPTYSRASAGNYSVIFASSVLINNKTIVTGGIRSTGDGGVTFGNINGGSDVTTLGLYHFTTSTGAAIDNLDKYMLIISVYP